MFIQKVNCAKMCSPMLSHNDCCCKQLHLCLGIMSHMQLLQTAWHRPSSRWHTVHIGYTSTAWSLANDKSRSTCVMSTSSCFGLPLFLEQSILTTLNSSNTKVVNEPVSAPVFPCTAPLWPFSASVWTDAAPPAVVTPPARAIWAATAAAAAAALVLLRLGPRLVPVLAASCILQVR